MSLYSTFVLPAIDMLSGEDSERAHLQALRALQICGLSPLRQILRNFTFVRNERKVFGITFPNPVGVAAGLDKHGTALYGIEAFGFGFVEVGTVTPMPQPGNPRPRLFRLTGDEAVINRMGFNNYGIDAMAKRLSGYQSLGIPVGINIGKGKETPIENAADDYEKGIRKLYAHADYITINTSSPNTKDLRRLQERDRLVELLERVRSTVSQCAGARASKPVLLKISPDLSIEELDDVLSVSDGKVQGLIISNTTIDRPETLRSRYRTETGGLSGKPVQARALELVKYAHRTLPNMPIVGVGGIFNPDDALRMFDAGASLVQLYTGLVYEGPLLPYRINKAIQAREQKNA